jgi:hypothetical protein
MRVSENNCTRPNHTKRKKTLAEVANALHVDKSVCSLKDVCVWGGGGGQFCERPDVVHKQVCHGKMTRRKTESFQ